MPLPFLRGTVPFIFPHSFHLLFSLVSFSLFCHCLCNSAEYFNIHFNYHLLLSRSLHSSIRIIFFTSSPVSLAFICISFFSLGLQFIFPFSISFYLLRSSAHSLFAFPSAIFFLFNNFSHPQSESKATESERETASYIFIPR